MHTHTYSHLCAATTVKASNWKIELLAAYLKQVNFPLTHYDCNIIIDVIIHNQQQQQQHQD